MPTCAVCIHQQDQSGKIKSHCCVPFLLSVLSLCSTQRGPTFNIWSWKNHPSTKVIRSLFFGWIERLNSTKHLLWYSSRFIPICPLHQTASIKVTNFGSFVAERCTMNSQKWRNVQQSFQSFQLICDCWFPFIKRKVMKSVTNFRALNFQRQPKLMFVHEVLTRTRILIESTIS